MLWHSISVHHRFRFAEEKVFGKTRRENRTFVLIN
jgi:hypothetical protein